MNFLVRDSCPIYCRLPECYIGRAGQGPGLKLEEEWGKLKGVLIPFHSPFWADKDCSSSTDFKYLHGKTDFYIKLDHIILINPVQIWMLLQGTDGREDQNLPLLEGSKMLIWTRFLIKLQLLIGNGCKSTEKSNKILLGGKKKSLTRFANRLENLPVGLLMIPEIYPCCFTAAALTYNWNATFKITNSISFYCSKRRNKLTGCLVHVLHTGSYHRSVVFTHLNQSAKHKKASVRESCLSFSLMTMVN